MIHFKSSYSFNILLRLIITTVLLVVIVYYNSDYIQNVYLKNQLTYTGYIINGSIIGIFLLGMIKLILSLLFYWREERAVGSFIVNVHHEDFEPRETIDKNSLIYHRYMVMKALHHQHVEINHSAMASTLIASESIRLSLPRFIANILILTGVFGTIMSLSIALLGASNLMEENGISSMGQVIHGMSTALSTTTTAIVCYFLFGYFYLKLMDIQTNLFSAIEQITTQYLMPHFSYQSENMVHQMADIIKLLNHTTANMKLSQQQYMDLTLQLNTIITEHDSRVGNLTDNMNDIKSLLKQGFRLPDEPSPAPNKAIHNPPNNPLKKPLDEPIDNSIENFIDQPQPSHKDFNEEKFNSRMNDFLNSAAKVNKE